MNALASALKIAASIVDQSSIPIFQNVKLEADAGALAITTRNSIMELRQSIPFGDGSWVTTVDAKRFASIASITKGKLSIEPGARLKISGTGGQWDLPVLAADDWGAIRFDGEHSVKVRGDSFLSALIRVSPAISTEMARSYLGGIFMHSDGGRMRLVATDGSKLISAILDAEFPAEAPDVIIPPQFIQALAKLPAETISLSWNDRKIRAIIGNATLTCGIIDGTFPDYKRVIPAPSKADTFNRVEMLDALRRVQLVQTDSRDHLVHFCRAAGRIELSVTSPEAGLANQSIAADCGSDVHSAFNGRHLTSVLEAIGGETVEFHQTEARSPTLIRRAVPDGAVSVLMPIRV